MIENKNDAGRNLEKALQALEQAKQRVVSEKKKQNRNTSSWKRYIFQLIKVTRIKGAYAEPFAEWRKDNAETVESRHTVFASRV